MHSKLPLGPERDHMHVRMGFSALTIRTAIGSLIEGNTPH